MAEQNIQIGTTVLVLTQQAAQQDDSETETPDQTYLSMIRPMNGDNNI